MTVLANISIIFDEPSSKEGKDPITLNISNSGDFPPDGDKGLGVLIGETTEKNLPMWLNFIVPVYAENVFAENIVDFVEDQIFIPNFEEFFLQVFWQG